MPLVTINGQAVEAPEGSTLLTAATAMGIRVPTLCHLAGSAPLATCMVCLVEDRARGRLLPACSTRVEGGMCVETDSELAQAGRRAALELLLSEHAGECEAPCVRACPLGIEIPEILDDLEVGDVRAAWQRLRSAVALPATAARLCASGCEKACRRRALDQPVRVAQVHTALAAWGLAQSASPEPAPSGQCVTIVGAGPSGLAAADALSAHGHTCRVLEMEHSAGGSLRRHLAADPAGSAILDAEIERLLLSRVTLEVGVRVGVDVSWEDVRRDGDLLLLATGDVAFQSRSVLSSMVHGREMGRAAHSRLVGRPATAPHRVCAQLGSVKREELEALRLSREQRCRDRAVSVRVPERWGEGEQAEARRCLGCGCRSARSCELRQLCDEHAIDPRRFSGIRRQLEPAQEHALIRHEPGKCVLCGRCVRLAELAGEALGLAVCGRGFAARVRVPLEKPLAASLERCALACAEACPTGALSIRPRACGGEP